MLLKDNDFSLFFSWSQLLDYIVSLLDLYLCAVHTIIWPISIHCILHLCFYFFFFSFISALKNARKIFNSERVDFNLEYGFLVNVVDGTVNDRFFFSLKILEKFTDFKINHPHKLWYNKFSQFLLFIDHLDVFSHKIESNNK